MAKGRVTYTTDKGKTKKIKPLTMKKVRKAMKKQRKNVLNMGRILQGPQGGQFTSSGRGKNKVGDKIIE